MSRYLLIRRAKIVGGVVLLAAVVWGIYPLSFRLWIGVRPDMRVRYAAVPLASDGTELIAETRLTDCLCVLSAATPVTSGKAKQYGDPAADERWGYRDGGRFIADECATWTPVAAADAWLSLNVGEERLLATYTTVDGYDGELRVRCEPRPVVTEYD